MQKQLNGNCHCGAIRVALTMEESASLSPRHCGCDFCQRHGALYVSVPAGELTLTLTEPDLVSRYRFGHETATFLLCQRCGVLAAATCELEGQLYAVLNANVLAPPLTVDQGSVPVADYEAEGIDVRLGRRRQRWISQVTVVEGSPA